LSFEAFRDKFLSSLSFPLLLLLLLRDSSHGAYSPNSAQLDAAVGDPRQGNHPNLRTLFCRRDFETKMAVGRHVP
jgi:hypothetical protein